MNWWKRIRNWIRVRSLVQWTSPVKEYLTFCNKIKKWKKTDTRGMEAAIADTWPNTRSCDVFQREFAETTVFLSSLYTTGLRKKTLKAMGCQRKKCSKKKRIVPSADKVMPTNNFGQIFGKWYNYYASSLDYWLQIKMTTTDSHKIFCQHAWASADSFLCSCDSENDGIIVPTFTTPPWVRLLRTTLLVSHYE